MLLSITAIIRPKHALESASVQQLIHASGSVDQHMDKHAAICVHEMVANCFVLPWPYVNNCDQDYERRGQLLQDYVSALAHDLLRLDHTTATGQQEKIVKITAAVLPTLKEILDYFKEQNSSVKQMLLAAYRVSVRKNCICYNLI